MTMTMDRVRHGSFKDLRRASSPHLCWATAGAAVGNLVTTLLDWQERARQRRRLLTLGDGALKDFGRSRADAAGEGDKPFWRA